MARGAVRVREGRVVLAPLLEAKERQLYRVEVEMVRVCLAEVGVAWVWRAAVGGIHRTAGGCRTSVALGTGCHLGTPPKGPCGQKGVARVLAEKGEVRTEMTEDHGRPREDHGRTNHLGRSI